MPEPHLVPFLVWLAWVRHGARPSVAKALHLVHGLQGERHRDLGHEHGGVGSATNESRRDPRFRECRLQ